MTFHLLGFACLVASLALILYVTFIQRRRWSEVEFVQVHMKIGGAACMLYLVQMTTGWVRPIDQGNRRIFSLFHWIVGTSTVGLSFTNLILGPKMMDTKTPCAVTLLIIIAAVWTITFHIIMAVSSVSL